MILTTQNKLCTTETYPDKFVTDGWANFAATRTASVGDLSAEPLIKSAPGSYVSPYVGNSSNLKLHVVDGCLVWDLFQHFFWVGSWWRSHSVKFCVPQAASPVGDYIVYSLEWNAGGVAWYPAAISGTLAGVRYSVA